MGVPSSYANFPTPSYANTINNLPGVTNVVACYEFTLILTTSGEVYVLGSNSDYQLGTGNAQTYNTPFLNPFLTGIIGVGCGSFHSFFWNSSGVYATGQNLVSASSPYFF